MVYALTITVAVGLLLLAIALAAAFLIARFPEAARRGYVPFGRWRFYPNPLGLLLLLALPAAGMLLWRAFPAVLFIPFVLPFFWRWGRRRSGAGMPFFIVWRDPEERHTSSNGHRNGRHDRVE
jgi:hypothetical protein